MFRGCKILMVLYYQRKGLWHKPPRGILDQLSIHDFYTSFTKSGNLFIVGDNNYRFTLLINLGEQVHDILTIPLIQGTGYYLDNKKTLEYQGFWQSK